MTTMAIDNTCKRAQTGTEAACERPRFRPAVDILESASEVTILADMPGVGLEDIEIQFEDGTLTVHGRVRPRETISARASKIEYEVGDFHRTFRVGEKVDAANIHAALANGVLTVHLPKVVAVQPRKITVRSD